MGFEDRYTIHFRDKYSVISEKSTILPFWNFYASENHETHEHYTPEKTTIESIGNGKWEVTHTPGKVSTSKGEKYFNFTRRGSFRFLDEKEKDLENRFYSMVEGKYSSDGIFYPGKTPYLHTSVKEFYDDRINPMGRLGWFIGLFPGCSVLTFFFLMQPLYDGIAPIAGILGAIWCAIFVIGFKKLKSKRYNKLSNEKKEKIRKKYLYSLDVGIEEANAILREYAILKGYDKI